MQTNAPPFLSQIQNGPPHLGRPWPIQLVIAGHNHNDRTQTYPQLSIQNVTVLMAVLILIVDCGVRALVPLDRFDIPLTSNRRTALANERLRLPEYLTSLQIHDKPPSQPYLIVVSHALRLTWPNLLIWPYVHHQLKFQ